MNIYEMDSTCARTRPVSLFDNEHGALRELGDAVRAASDESFVQRRMPHRADNEQLHLEFGGELDDIAHRVPDQDMRPQLQLAFPRCVARAPQHVGVTPIRGFFRVADIGDELR